jgi:nucleotide-binding universal stress UspA family protein
MAKTIIVPLDGSEFAERALTTAHNLARQSGAEIVLVTSRLGGVPESDSYLRLTAQSAGMESARTIVFEDRLADAAIATLAENEPDALVCMTTHARGGLGEAVFGSVTERVLHQAYVPLVLVGPSVADVGTRTFEELVVCLDGSRAAGEILPRAALVARDLDIPMLLVGVVDPDTVRKPSTDDPVALEAAPLRLAARTLGGSGLAVSWEVIHGRDPASAIVDFATTRATPLLAMTTHGRTGLARVTTGSVTMSVVQHASCPVLVRRTRLTRVA